MGIEIEEFEILLTGVIESWGCGIWAGFGGGGGGGRGSSAAGPAPSTSTPTTASVRLSSSSTSIGSPGSETSAILSETNYQLAPFMFSESKVIRFQLVSHKLSNPLKLE